MSLKNPAVYIALGLFFSAFLLRLVGIGWGLPNDLHNQSYHPDELVNYSVSQQIDLARGKVAPGFYNYGTAYFFALNIASNAINGYGGGPDPENPAGLWQYIGRVHLAGRIINAAAGAACVVCIWLICRRITTRFGALFGAGLIALAPAFVVHSRFQTVDVFATFWIALSAVFALRLLGAMPGSDAEQDQSTSGDLKDVVLAGVFAGIAAGTKYTGILVILVLWISLALNRQQLKQPWWLLSLVGFGCALAAFLVTTPGVALDWSGFSRDVGYEISHTAAGHGLIFIDTPSGFIYHIGNLAAGLGILLTLAGSIGLAYAAFRRHPWALAILAFALVYYISIGRAEVKFLRYTFPLLIPLAIGFGYGMGAARRNGGWGHAAVAGGFVALAGLDFGGLSGAVRYTLFMAGNDPRDEAAMYLKGKNSVGLVKDPWFWTPAVIPDAGLTRAPNAIRAIYAEVESSSNPKVLRYLPDGQLEGRLDWDTRLIDEMRPEYIAFSSFEVHDELRLSSSPRLDAGTQAQVDRYKAFYAKLEQEYKLDNIFGGLVPEIHDLMYIRPTVYVWKRKNP